MWALCDALCGLSVDSAVGLVNLAVWTECGIMCGLSELACVDSVWTLNSARHGVCGQSVDRVLTEFGLIKVSAFGLWAECGQSVDRVWTLKGRRPQTLTKN